MTEKTTSILNSQLVVNSGLKEISLPLQEQVKILEKAYDFALKEADDAKKEAKFARIVSVIAILVAVSALTADITMFLMRLP